MASIHDVFYDHLSIPKLRMSTNLRVICLNMTTNDELSAALVEVTGIVNFLCIELPSAKESGPSPSLDP
jgi:hypothetical protein